MDELLAAALQDFEQDFPEAVATIPRPPSGQAAAAPCQHSSTAEGPGADATATEATAATTTTVTTAATTARGPSLPARGSKPSATRAAGAGPSCSPQPAAATGASASARPAGMPQLPARGQKQAKAQAKAAVRPDVQRLADDLIRLMEESGLGSESEGSSLPDELGALDQLDTSQLTSPVVRDLAERALRAVEAEVAQGPAHASSSSTGASATTSTAGATSSGEPTYRSAALRGLADQTKHMVEQQSKVARGEGKGSAPAAAAGGSGGGLFGDMFGMLNSVAGSGLGGGAGGLGGGRAEGGGMGFMVDYIMQNLLSKEVLYAPLKDIRDKYPPWLDANRDTLSPEDLQRYTAQYASIQAVCKQYEDDASNFKRLVDLIQEMQTYGDPPSAIVEAVVPESGSGGLMGASGDADDIGNFDMPELDDLPKELKDKCPIQ